MIKICEAKKYIGEKEILKGISLNVNKGEVFGLIGTNGAGKTTLIKCMTGIWELDKGYIKINGESVFENKNIKSKIGYVADVNDYYSFLKIKEIIKFYELSYSTFDRKRFNELNKVFEIDEDKFIKQLSKGMKTRFAIMLNLSIMPEILILDEPTSGLDPIIKNKVFDIILDDVAERNTTVFISSHNLSDIERVCDSIAIINDGTVKYSNSIENMKSKIKKLQVIFKNEEPEDLKAWKGVLELKRVGKAFNIITDEYEKLLKKFEAYDTFIEELDLQLEDVFIYSIGSDVSYEIFK